MQMSSLLISLREDILTELHKIKKTPEKLTIYHIRSIQAKVKYSILLLQHRLKKLLYFQKVGGRIMQMFSLLIPKGRYSERSAQD